MLDVEKTAKGFFFDPEKLKKLRTVARERNREREEVKRAAVERKREEDIEDAKEVIDRVFRERRGERGKVSD